jgi:hypothetical protein
MIIEKAIAIADAYEVARVKQNAGEACTHCECSCGHYGFCPLINRNSCRSTQRRVERC